MREASLQDEKGYEWTEFKLQKDDWKQELSELAGSEIVSVEEGHNQTLRVQFEDGTRVVVEKGDTP